MKGPARRPAPARKAARARPGALADAELLALLLRTGLPARACSQLAQQLLERHGGLGGLLRHRAGPEGHQGPGPGQARRAGLAVMEIARRALAQPLRASARCSIQPAAVKDYLASCSSAGLPHEVFAVLFLDHQHRLLAWRRCSAAR
jgi:DNA repair protein RadC